MLLSLKYNNTFHISKASDLENFKDRILYRVFETLPGFLSFGTFALFIFLSVWYPFFVAVFAILFVLFWFFRFMHFAVYVKKGLKKINNNMKEDWAKKLSSVKGHDKIYHLIVIPTYDESPDIILDTLSAIASSNYDAKKIIVCVSIEEVHPYKDILVSEINKKYRGSFLNVITTIHPKELICGKSSNENWGIKEAKKYIDGKGIDYENIIYTSLDSDTVLSKDYLACLTFHFLTTENRFRKSYQPIPFFLNNILEAPFFSRVFSFSITLWHIRCQERKEKLTTFSSHSMPFKTLLDVGLKTEKVVSDDSRIFWQCFFRYDGNYETEPLFYPVSMDTNMSSSITKTFINIYKQQRRWSYGASEIPYFLFMSVKNKNISLSKKISFGFELVETHWTWATAPILIFSLGLMPVYLGGESFSQTLISYNLPSITSNILRLSMIGIFLSSVFSIGILITSRFKLRKLNILKIFFEWLITPFIMIFFSAFPSLEAQFRLMIGKYMGFWPTEKWRKDLKRS